jgi:hypothetical protein
MPDVNPSGRALAPSEHRCFLSTELTGSAKKERCATNTVGREILNVWLFAMVTKKLKNGGRILLPKQSITITVAVKIVGTAPF